MRAVPGLLLSLISVGAVPCTLIPKHLRDPPAVLVQSTSTIVLARAVSFTDSERGSFATFEFESIRALKGEPPKTFRIQGYHSTKVNGPGDFKSHKDPKFWAFETGNSIQPGSCRAHGIYEVGLTYLIFLRENSHYRAYENIRSPEDLWLNVVETLLREDSLAH